MAMEINFTRLLVVALLAIGTMGCEGTQAPPTTTSGWKKLGTVSDGVNQGNIFWIINEETGDRVYVMVGSDKGGIYVMPGKPVVEALKR
jgi:hypothetical protein